MSELRQNILTGDWVVIATHRAMRPESFSREPKPPVGKSLSGCPFCAGNEGQTPPEVMALRPDGPADGLGWRVRVVPNKYPAFSPSAGPISPENDFASRPANGRHEVIIHGPDHDRTLAKMSEAEIEAVFSVYKERLKALALLPEVASAIIIVNQGREAGASIEHPHSQLFALPLVAPLIEREMERVEVWRAERNECPVCSMVAHELSSGARLVAQNEHFVAFCPFASRVPFETYIVPRVHERNFAAAGDILLQAAAAIVKTVLARVGARLGDPPYNLYLHTAPFRSEGDYHWHFALLPKLSVIAGFELGSGIMINVADPEGAAEFLR